mmetsp:Transcript_5920/g.10643  ORF Transcript_5920/g.10643 Transcript_5920/m.10643 type:complete len:203 (-) Transcript_5920:572-1180(-)
MTMMHRIWCLKNRETMSMATRFLGTQCVDTTGTGSLEPANGICTRHETHGCIVSAREPAVLPPYPRSKLSTIRTGSLFANAVKRMTRSKGPIFVSGPWIPQLPARNHFRKWSWPRPVTAQPMTTGSFPRLEARTKWVEAATALHLPQLYPPHYQLRTQAPLAPRLYLLCLWSHSCHGSTKLPSRLLNKVMQYPLLLRPTQKS